MFVLSDTRESFYRVSHVRHSSQTTVVKGEQHPPTAEQACGALVVWPIAAGAGAGTFGSGTALGWQ